MNPTLLKLLCSPTRKRRRTMSTARNILIAATFAAAAFAMANASAATAGKAE